MKDVFFSILGGGFAGAGLIIFLSKLILKNQLEKSQRKFQHHLDRKKIQLEMELSAFFESKKEHSISYQNKSILAIEDCYSAITSTSLPRHLFRKYPTVSKFAGAEEEQMTSKYFHLFSENFQAFSRAFDSVTNAFSKLEEAGLYIDSDLEEKVTTTLQKIHEFYIRKHNLMRHAHDQAKAHFDGKILEQKLRTFDFEEFHSLMVQEWNLETQVIRHELKSKLREVLQPSKLESHSEFN